MGLQWDVEVTGTGGSYIGRAPNKLAGLYTLIFRRSSCQHPLMAGALGPPPLPLSFPFSPVFYTPCHTSCHHSIFCNGK